MAEPARFDDFSVTGIGTCFFTSNLSAPTNPDIPRPARLAAAYRRQHLQIHADRFLSGRAGRYFKKPRLQPEPTELDTFNRRYRSGEGVVCRADGAAVGGTVRAVSQLAAGGNAGAFGGVRADGLHRHDTEFPAASGLLCFALGNVGGVRLRDAGFVVHRPAAPRTRFRRRDSDDGGAQRQDDRRRAGVVAVSGIRVDGGGRFLRLGNGCIACGRDDFGVTVQPHRA